MKKRQLGSTNLEVPPIIFGAWAIGGWYWGGKDDKESMRAIHASMDAGVTAFDTAPVYGFGHSEKILGEALQGRRNQAIICTKVGLRWDKDDGVHFFDSETDNKKIYRNLRPQSIREEVENSLRRLQTDRIDLLQCHWPDPSTQIEETMQTLSDLVNEGKVLAIGVSNFDSDLLERSQLRLSPIPLASTQPKYSLLDRRIEADVIPWLCKNNVAAIVYSPLEQGLLSGKVTLDREFPDSDGRSRHPLFSGTNRLLILEALNKILHIAKEHRVSLAQLTTAWCFHQPGITAAIVGARTATQAIENANACHITLSKTEIEEISSVFSVLECSR
jgi:methylglyoxal reductase